MIEPTAVGTFGGKWPGRSKTLGQCCFGFFRQKQTAEATGGIGERGGYRMMTIEPDGATRSFGRTRAGALAVRRRAAMARPALMLRARLKRTLRLLVSLLRPRAELTGAALSVRSALGGRSWAAKTGPGLSVRVVS